jgi:hypothetical protein
LKYRLPIKKGGEIPVIAVISLGDAKEPVVHDTVPQTPEEEEWLNAIDLPAEEEIANERPTRP